MKLFRIFALLIYGVIVYYFCSLTNGEEIIDRYVVYFVFYIPIFSLVYWGVILVIFNDIKENCKFSFDN